MVYHPLSLLVGCVIALPVLVPWTRLRRWRYAAALAATAGGVTAAWALNAAKVIDVAPQTVVEHGLAAAAVLIVSIRAFYEGRADAGEREGHPRAQVWTGEFPRLSPPTDDKHPN